jgi:hypothetical protein
MPVGPTFGSWLVAQAGRSDQVGELARRLLDDRLPVLPDDGQGVLALLHEREAPPQAIAALTRAQAEHENDYPPPGAWPRV